MLPISPSRWYLTGLLAPQGARTPEVDDEECTGELAADDESQAEDAGVTEPEPKRQVQFPASMGLSVFLPPGKDDFLEVEVRYADYDKIEITEDDDRKKRSAWKRVPHAPPPTMNRAMHVAAMQADKAKFAMIPTYDPAGSWPVVSASWFALDASATRVQVRLERIDGTGIVSTELTTSTVGTWTSTSPIPFDTPIRVIVTPLDGRHAGAPESRYVYTAPEPPRSANSAADTQSFNVWFTPVAATSYRIVLTAWDNSVVIQTIDTSSSNVHIVSGPCHVQVFSSPPSEANLDAIGLAVDSDGLPSCAEFDGAAAGVALDLSDARFVGRPGHNCSGAEADATLPQGAFVESSSENVVWRDYVLSSGANGIARHDVFGLATRRHRVRRRLPRPLRGDRAVGRGRRSDGLVSRFTLGRLGPGPEGAPTARATSK